LRDTLGGVIDFMTRFAIATGPQDFAATTDLNRS
jgi:hypothetical protein